MIDTILFDWDGTLVDTARQSFAAFRKTFADLDFPLDLDTYDRIYSPNWYSMYVQLRLPPEKWQEADDLWLQHYECETAQLMPGGQTTLDKLKSRNYGLGVVTSGNRIRVRREISALGLTDVFDAVVCSEDVVNKKPHPEGLQLAMERMRKQPQSCCYVGDSPDDIEMGRQGNVVTIAIPGRYPGSRNLADCHPDYTFTSLEEFCLQIAALCRDSRRL